MSEESRVSLTRFYKSIEPHGYGNFGVEEFDDFARHVMPLLPHFPPEVLEDWIYRHHGDAVRTYGWLDFRRLRFEKQSWSTERIVSQIRSRIEDTVEGWARVFAEGSRAGHNHRKSRLGAIMVAQGTWPVAPLVFPDTSMMEVPSGVVLQPCHLVEGHHRLAYLRALARMPSFEPQPQHEVWVMGLESA